MKAEYRDGATPGTGVIVLEGLADTQQLNGIAIQRSSDQNFLADRAKNPWTGEVFYFPVQADIQGDRAEIAIGPQIVDRLDPQDQYALRFKGGNDRVRLQVKSVTYSPSGSRGNTAQEPEPAPAPPISTPVQPEPVPQPTQPTPQPAQPAPTPTENLQLPQPAADNGAKKLIIPLVLGVLLLAGIAWYFLQKSSAEATPAPPVAETPLPEAQVPEPQAPEKPAQPETPPPPQEAPEQAKAPATPGITAQVDEFFKGGRISPKEAADLAERLKPQTPAEQDAIYRLLYFAAENGESSAYLPYAATLDPATAPFGTIQKNGLEAWKQYEKAQAADPQKAAEAMRDLRQWLSDQASNHNAKAREWLLQIDAPR